MLEEEAHTLTGRGWITETLHRLHAGHDRIQFVGHRPNAQELIDFVATAPLEESALSKERHLWQQWADRFFMQVVTRYNKKEREAFLSQLIERFEPRRYALMLEMLGIYAVDSERAEWLSELTQGYLDSHRHDLQAQEALILLFRMSSVPERIKNDMMQKLSRAYGDFATVAFGSSFTDSEACPVSPDGQRAGSDGLSSQHR